MTTIVIIAITEAIAISAIITAIDIVRNKGKYESEE